MTIKCLLDNRMLDLKVDSIDEINIIMDKGGTLWIYVDITYDENDDEVHIYKVAKVYVEH